MRSTAIIRYHIDRIVSKPVLPGVIVLGVALQHPCSEIEFSSRIVTGCHRLFIKILYTVVMAIFNKEKLLWKK